MLSDRNSERQKEKTIIPDEQSHDPRCIDDMTGMRWALPVFFVSEKNMSGLFPGCGSKCTHHRSESPGGNAHPYVFSAKCDIIDYIRFVRC